jgi:hypothetical protein
MLYESPAHQDQLAVLGVAGFSDDGLHGGGSNVAVGVGHDEVGQIITDAEVLRDLLLIRLAIVATAHIKSRPDKWLQVYGQAKEYALKGPGIGPLR